MSGQAFDGIYQKILNSRLTTMAALNLMGIQTLLPVGRREKRSVCAGKREIGSQSKDWVAASDRLHRPFAPYSSPIRGQFRGLRADWG